jgi:rhodanese-related sulfurtransferase
MAATSSYSSVGWEEVLQKPRHDSIVDVRRADEFEKSHLQEGVNIPLHELLPRMDEVPAGRLWVHCGSEYRSAVAASLLQRAGRDVVHVNATFKELQRSGLKMA